MTTLMAFSLILMGAAQGPLYQAEEIFPAVPMHAHGSTLVETPRGDLLAAWFYGKAEKSDDTLIIQGARLKKSKSGWSKPFLMADSQDLPDQNPVLFIDPQRTLWLFWIASLDNTYDTYVLKYKIAKRYNGDAAPEWNWQDVIHCRPQNLDKLFVEDTVKNPQDYVDFAASHKKYPTWLEDAKKTSAQKLSQRLGWMTRIHPIMTSETRMILPLYSDAFACSLAAITENGGKSWTFSEPILNLNVQACFVKKQSGDIVAYMRDRGGAKRIPMSVSKDNGLTWSHVQKTEMPNPDSSVDCIALKNGHWIMVCNDTTGGLRGGRNQLTALLSDDEGVTWKWKRTLEKHGESCAASYPCVIQTRDGSIHCTYTYSPSPNESIKHVRFNEVWIQEGDK